MTEVTTMNTSLPENLDKLSTEDMMRLTGQLDHTVTKASISRLAINHATEDFDGNALPRGHFSLTTPPEGPVYGEKATMRVFMRTYSYFVWDNEAGAFSCQTVQAPSFSSDFYDTEGGLKCGKLDYKTIEALPKDSPEWAVQKSIKCSQNLYGLVSFENAVNKDGSKAVVKDVPCIWYAKGANFSPVADCLKSLSRQKQPMWLMDLGLTSVKKKKGGNIYFHAELTPQKPVAWAEEDDARMRSFMEYVKGYNDNVMKTYHSAADDKIQFDSVVNE